MSEHPVLVNKALMFTPRSAVTQKFV